MYLPYYIMQQPPPMNAGAAPPFMPGGPMPPLAPGPAERENIKNQVKAQIEYYFGTENMLKDVWLRQKMNDDGWVPVSLIAGFKRLQTMTTDLGLVLEAISGSQELELDAQGANVRLRNNWKTWTLSGKGGAAGAPGDSAEAAPPSPGMAPAPPPGAPAAAPSRS
jgi:la-related protein 1